MQENLGEIGRASARAADLVRQILTFGRPHDVKREPLHLRPVVDEALKLVRATLPAMIDIRLVCAEGVLPIFGDATQIHQIVVNLCTNSAHALEARRGSIELRLEPVTIATQPAPLPPGLRPGRFSCLSVSDNGAGMTAETLERIFDPFYTTKAPGHGTGLGLSVVHGIVSSYGGAITVYSQPGKGSTFRLFFPALASELGDTVPIERAQAPLGHGERVLYIDDEAALVSLALRVLTRLGYVVVGHTNVARALEEFRAGPQTFDAVVTDLSMPGMSGVELVTELQATRPDVPILITSGYVPPEEQEAALRLGVRELIPKPTLDRRDRPRPRPRVHEASRAGARRALTPLASALLRSCRSAISRPPRPTTRESTPASRAGRSVGPIGSAGRARDPAAPVPRSGAPARERRTARPRSAPARCRPGHRGSRGATRGSTSAARRAPMARVARAASAASTNMSRGRRATPARSRASGSRRRAEASDAGDAIRAVASDRPRSRSPARRLRRAGSR